MIIMIMHPRHKMITVKRIIIRISFIIIDNDWLIKIIICQRYNFHPDHSDNNDCRQILIYRISMIIMIIWITLTILTMCSRHILIIWGRLSESQWLSWSSWSCAQDTSASSESNWYKIHYDNLGQILRLRIIIYQRNIIINPICGGVENIC